MHVSEDDGHNVSQNEESSKYWRICADIPAAAGVAMLVPDIGPIVQDDSGAPDDIAE